MTNMIDLDRLIGNKIRVEYYDHNEPFGNLLPRDGLIEKRYVTENVDDWYLLKLDLPFEYGGKSQRYFLIRSKWAGESIGTGEKCAVFILLIPDMKFLNTTVIDVENFIHVAWGFAQVI